MLLSMIFGKRRVISTIMAMTMIITTFFGTGFSMLRDHGSMLTVVDLEDSEDQNNTSSDDSLNNKEDTTLIDDENTSETPETDPEAAEEASDSTEITVEGEADDTEESFVEEPAVENATEEEPVYEFWDFSHAEHFDEITFGGENDDEEFLRVNTFAEWEELENSPENGKTNRRVIFHLDLESLFGYNQVWKIQNAAVDENVDRAPYFFYVLDNTQHQVDSDLEFRNGVRESKTEDASRKVYYDLKHLSDEYTAHDFELVYEIPEDEMHREFNLEVGIGKFRQDDPEDPETETTLEPLVSQDYLFYIANTDQEAADVLNRDVYDVNFKLADNGYPEDFAADFTIEEIAPDYFPADYIAFNDFNLALYPGETEENYLSYQYLPQGTYKVTLTPNYDDYEPLEETFYFAGQDEDRYFDIQKKTQTITIQLTGDEEMLSRIVGFDLFNTETEALLTVDYDAETDSYSADVPYGEYQFAFFYDDMTTLPQFTVTLNGIEEDPTYLRFNVDETTVLPLNLVYTVQEDEVTEETEEQPDAETEPTEDNDVATIVLSEDDLKQAEEESTAKDEEEAAEQSEEETAPTEEQPAEDEQPAADEEQSSEDEQQASEAEEQPVEAEHIKLDDIVEDEKPEETEEQQEEIQLPEDKDEQAEEAAEEQAAEEEQPADEEQAEEEVQEPENTLEKLQENPLKVPVLKTGNTGPAVEYDKNNQPGNVALSAMRGQIDVSQFDFESDNARKSGSTDKLAFKTYAYLDGSDIIFRIETKRLKGFLSKDFNPAIKIISNSPSVGIQTPDKGKIILPSGVFIESGLENAAPSTSYSDFNSLFRGLFMASFKLEKKDQKGYVNFRVPVNDTATLYSLTLQVGPDNGELSNPFTMTVNRELPGPTIEKGSFSLTLDDEHYTNNGGLYSPEFPTATVELIKAADDDAEGTFATRTVNFEDWTLQTISDAPYGLYHVTVNAAEDMIVTKPATQLLEINLDAGTDGLNYDIKVEKKPEIPTHGTLTVNVDGKGSTYTGDGNPTIRITGPNGYSKEITGADAWQRTLDSLEFGRYHVVINPASDMQVVGDLTYDVTLDSSNLTAEKTFVVKNKEGTINIEIDKTDYDGSATEPNVILSDWVDNKAVNPRPITGFTNDWTKTINVPCGDYHVELSPADDMVVTSDAWVYFTIDADEHNTKDIHFKIANKPTGSTRIEMVVDGRPYFAGQQSASTLIIPVSIIDPEGNTSANSTVSLTKGSIVTSEGTFTNILPDENYKIKFIDVPDDVVITSSTGDVQKSGTDYIYSLTTVNPDTGGNVPVHEFTFEYDGVTETEYEQTLVLNFGDGIALNDVLNSKIVFTRDTSDGDAPFTYTHTVRDNQSTISLPAGKYHIDTLDIDGQYQLTEVLEQEEIVIPSGLVELNYIQLSQAVGTFTIQAIDSDTHEPKNVFVTVNDEQVRTPYSGEVQAGTTLYVTFAGDNEYLPTNEKFFVKTTVNDDFTVVLKKRPHDRKFKYNVTGAPEAKIEQITAALSPGSVNTLSPNTVVNVACGVEYEVTLDNLPEGYKVKNNENSKRFKVDCDANPGRTTELNFELVPDENSGWETEANIINAGSTIDVVPSVRYDAASRELVWTLEANISSGKNSHYLFLYELEGANAGYLQDNENTSFKSVLNSAKVYGNNNVYDIDIDGLSSSNFRAVARYADKDPVNLLYAGFSQKFEFRTKVSNRVNEFKLQTEFGVSSGRAGNTNTIVGSTTSTELIARRTPLKDLKITYSADNDLTQDEKNGLEVVLRDSTGTVIGKRKLSQFITDSADPSKQTTTFKGISEEVHRAVIEPSFGSSIAIADFEIEATPHETGSSETETAFIGEQDTSAHFDITKLIKSGSVTVNVSVNDSVTGETLSIPEGTKATLYRRGINDWEKVTQDDEGNPVIPLNITATNNQFANLPYGIYRVVLDAPKNYQPQTQRSEPFTIDADQQNQSVDFTLSANPELDDGQAMIRTFTVDREPINGTTKISSITVTSTGATTSVQATYMGENGNNWLVEDLVEGTSYQVVAKTTDISGLQETVVANFVYHQETPYLDLFFNPKNLSKGQFEVILDSLDDYVADGALNNEFIKVRVFDADGTLIHDDLPLGPTPQLSYGDYFIEVDISEALTDNSNPLHVEPSLKRVTLNHSLQQEHFALNPNEVVNPNRLTINTTTSDGGSLPEDLKIELFSDQGLSLGQYAADNTITIDSLPVGHIDIVYTSSTDVYRLPTNAFVILSDRTQVAEVNFELERIKDLPKGSVELNFYDIRNSNPVDAQVRLTGPTDVGNPVAPKTYTFNSHDGKVLISDLPDGEYTYSYEATGYESLYKDESLNFTISDATPSYSATHPMISNATKNVVVRYRLNHEDGSPLPYDSFSIYERVSNPSGGYKDVFLRNAETGSDGNFTISPIYYGTFVLKADSDDGSVVDEVEFDVNENEPVNGYVTLIKKFGEGYGNIKARVVVERKKGTEIEYQPAVGTEIKILNGGVPLPESFKTDANGYITTGPLHIDSGQYVLVPEINEDFYESVEPTSHAVMPQEVWNEDDIPVFVLKPKTVIVVPPEEGPKLSVDGQLAGSKLRWTVRVEKPASKDKNVKRAPITTIKLPRDQQLNPTIPFLRKYIYEDENDDSPIIIEEQLDGRYYFEDNKFTFVDDQTSDLYEDYGSKKVVYEYYIVSDAVPESDYYDLEAETEFFSSHPLEEIPPAQATKRLENIHGDNFTATISGAGQADYFTQSTNWEWKSEIESHYSGSIKGDLVYEFDLPDKALQKYNEGLEDISNDFIITKEDGTPIDPSLYTLELLTNDDDKGTWEERSRIRVTFHVDRKNKFKETLKFKINNVDINREVDSEVYRMYGSVAFFYEGDEEPAQKEKTVAEAYRVMPLVEEHETFYVNCYKTIHYRIDIWGKPGGDNKSIMWTVRATNIRQDSLYDFHPVAIEITPGEGLLLPGQTSADVPPTMEQLHENADFNSTGKTFTYLTLGDSYQHYSGDGYTVTKPEYFTFQANLGPGSPVKYDDPKPSFRLPYVNNDGKKIDPVNTEYKFQPNYQRLSRGEYMEVTFKTPIDLENLNVNDPTSLQKEFKINVDTTVWEGVAGGDPELDYKRDMHEAKAYCNEHSELTVGTGLFQPDVKNCFFWEPKESNITTNAKLIERDNKRYIQWEIVAHYEKELAGELQGKKHDIEYTAELEKAEGLVGQMIGPLNTTGLGPIDPTSIEAENCSYKLDANKQKITVNANVKLGEITTVRFNTPIDESVANNISKYKMKTTGYRKNTSGSHPWFDYCTTEVDGFGKIFQVFKSWENTYDNEVHPAVTFKLYQQAPGSADKKVVDTLTLSETTEKFDQRYFENLQPAYTPDGQKYIYSIEEVPIEGYTTSRERLLGDGTLWLFTNRKDDASEESYDPTKYVTDIDGTYPEDMRQDGPDVRNAFTPLDENLNEDPNNWNDKDYSPNEDKYKIEYNDSIIGKSAQQTDLPGFFDMKLTIEGKTKQGMNGADVMFVVDNSNSMNEEMDTLSTLTLEKWNSLQNSLDYMKKTLLPNSGVDSGLNTNRVGLVNFATTTLPFSVTRHGTYKMQGDDGSYTTIHNPEYVKPYLIPLTNNPEQIALPNVPRQNRNGVPAGLNDGLIDVPGYDGLTNIAAGLRDGVDNLYNNGGQGKAKVLILITDGMPTAHLQLDKFDLDPEEDLEKQLRVNPRAAENYLAWKNDPYMVDYRYDPRDPENDRNFKYTIANNNLFLNQSGGYKPDNPFFVGDMSYYTTDGIHIQDHRLPTYAVANYYKRKYPDLQIYTVAVFSKSQIKNKEYEVPGKEAYYMQQICKNIASDPDNNYFMADNTEALMSFIDVIQDQVLSDSIHNGTVTDPMGEQIKLIRETNPNGVTLATNPDLTDGDFFVYANDGTYLKPDGNFEYDVSKLEEVEMRAYFGTDLKAPRGRMKVRLHPESHYIYQYKWIYDENDPYQAFGPSEWQDNKKGTGLEYVFAVNTVGAQTRATDQDYYAAAAAEGKDNLLIRQNYSPLVGGTWTELSAEESILDGVTLEVIDGVNDRDTIQLHHLNIGANQEVTVLYKTWLDSSDNIYTEDTYYQANKTTTLVPNPAIQDSQGDPVKRYFPIPSVKGPIGEISVNKTWFDGPVQMSGEDIPLDSIIVDVYRWQTEDFHNVFIEEDDITGDDYAIRKPILKEKTYDNDDGMTHPVRVQTVYLKKPTWQTQLGNLPVWDEEGNPYFYEVKERRVDGFTPSSKFYMPWLSYSKADGTTFKKYIDARQADGSYKYHQEVPSIELYEQEINSETGNIERGKLIGNQMVEVDSEGPNPNPETDLTTEITNKKLASIETYKVDVLSWMKNTANMQYQEIPEGIIDNPEFFDDYTLEGAEFDLYRAVPIVDLDDPSADVIDVPGLVLNDDNTLSEGTRRGFQIDEDFIANLPDDDEDGNTILYTMTAVTQEEDFNAPGGVYKYIWGQHTLMGIDYRDLRIYTKEQILRNYKINNDWGNFFTQVDYSDEEIEKQIKTRNEDGEILQQMIRFEFCRLERVTSYNKYTGKDEPITVKSNRDGRVFVDKIEAGSYVFKETVPPTGSFHDPGEFFGVLYVPTTHQGELYPKPGTQQIVAENFLKAGIAMPKLRETNSEKIEHIDVTGGEFIVGIPADTLDKYFPKSYEGYIDTEDFVLIPDEDPEGGVTYRKIYPIQKNNSRLVSSVRVLNQNIGKPHNPADENQEYYYPKNGWILFQPNDLPKLRYNPDPDQEFGEPELAGTDYYVPEEDVYKKDYIDLVVIETEAPEGYLNQKSTVPKDYSDEDLRGMTVYECKQEIKFNYLDYHSKKFPYKIFSHDNAIVNKSSGRKFVITKTDNSENPQPITSKTGRFELWKIVTDENKQSTFSPVTEGSDIVAKTPNLKGEIIFNDLSENALYYIVETEAPVGYLKDHARKVYNKTTEQYMYIYPLYKGDEFKFYNANQEEVPFSTESLKNLYDAANLRQDQEDSSLNETDNAWMFRFPELHEDDTKPGVIAIRETIENGPIEPIDLKLQKLDEDQKPLTGAEFTLYDFDTAVFDTAVDDNIDETTYTKFVLSEDKEEIGVFRFENMKPGFYLIEETKMPSGYYPKFRIFWLDVFHSKNGKRVSEEEADSSTKLMAKVHVLKIDKSIFENLDDSELIKPDDIYLDIYERLKNGILPDDDMPKYMQNAMPDSDLEVVNDKHPEIFLKYTNHPIELPATGGLGFTIWSLMAGLIFLSFAALVLRRNRLVWEGGGCR